MKESYTALVVAALCTYMTYSPLPAVAQSGGKWVESSNAPHCKLWFPDSQPIQQFEWNGVCGPDGKATDRGMVSWFSDGLIERMTDIEPGKGLVVEHGVISVRLPMANIHMTQEGCGIVKVEVPRDVTIAYDEVAEAILTKAAELSKSKCPGDGVDACIYYKGQEPDFGRPAFWTGCQVFWQWQRSRPNMSFDGYQNQPREEVRRLMDRMRAEAEKIRTAQRREAAAARASAARVSATNSGAARRIAFTKQYSVSIYPKISDVKVNPFRFQGQIVAIVQSFGSMLGPNRALMSDVVIDGVPTGLFKGGETALIAFRVTGNTSIKTAFGGEILAPTGKYVGSVICRSPSCSEYGMD
jgi:hypothetical protein